MKTIIKYFIIMVSKQYLNLDQQLLVIKISETNMSRINTNITNVYTCDIFESVSLLVAPQLCV